MKKVKLLFQMPTNDGYFGGIAVIINEYQNNKKLFIRQGFDIELWDYYECSSKIKNGVLNKFHTLFKQIIYIYKKIRQNDCDIFHIHTSRGWTFFKDLVLVKVISSFTKSKITITIHFAEAEKILSSNMFVKKFEMNVLKSNVNKIIFLSNTTRNEFVKYGIPKKRTAVLFTFHSYKDSCQLKCNNSKQINLVFMGSIDKRKGIIDLLKALNNLPQVDCILHICGKVTDKSIESKFNKLIDNLGHKVIFHGYVSGTEKERILEESDILVLPSYGEGMPIVIMEALYKGCAIISTKVGGIPELVNSTNGILIEPGNIKQLQSAILALCNDRKNLDSIKNINQKVGQQYSLSNHIKRLTEIYHTL